MGLKNRLARLEKDAGGRTCCPVELIEAAEGEPGPAEAVPPPGPRNVAGRDICSDCGLPVDPARIRFIAIRVVEQNVHEPDA